MDDLHDDARLAAEPLQVRPDRRRPGRPRDVSPVLVPLMRAPQGDAPRVEIASGLDSATDGMAVPGEEPALAFADEDDLRPARGIGMGLLLVLPFWASALYVMLR